MANNLLNYLVPQDMEQYLSFNGHHFNKLLCDFAVSQMERKDKATGAMKKIVPMTLNEMKSLLEKYKITIENNDMYDALYVANMVKADFFGTSIEDEQHMAKYIEDVICDPDGYDGLVFTRFLADCMGRGTVIFWEQYI